MKTLFGIFCIVSWAELVLNVMYGDAEQSLRVVARYLKQRDASKQEKSAVSNEER